MSVRQSVFSSNSQWRLCDRKQCCGSWYVTRKLAGIKQWACRNRKNRWSPVCWVFAQPTTQFPWDPLENCSSNGHSPLNQRALGPNQNSQISFWVPAGRVLSMHQSVLKNTSAQCLLMTSQRLLKLQNQSRESYSDFNEWTVLMATAISFMFECKFDTSILKLHKAVFTAAVVQHVVSFPEMIIARILHWISVVLLTILFKLDDSEAHFSV